MKFFGEVEFPTLLKFKRRQPPCHPHRAGFAASSQPPVSPALIAQFRPLYVSLADGLAGGSPSADCTPLGSGQGGGGRSLPGSWAMTHASRSRGMLSYLQSAYTAFP